MTNDEDIIEQVESPTDVISPLSLLEKQMESTLEGTRPRIVCVTLDYHWKASELNNPNFACRLVMTLSHSGNAPDIVGKGGLFVEVNWIRSYSDHDWFKDHIYKIFTRTLRTWRNVRYIFGYGMLKIEQESVEIWLITRSWNCSSESMVDLFRTTLHAKYYLHHNQIEIEQCSGGYYNANSRYNPLPSTTE